MPLAPNEKKQLDLALALAHFSASAVAAMAAALNRGKPIDDNMIEHLQKLLQADSTSAPAESNAYFAQIRRTLAGAHYGDD